MTEQIAENAEGVLEQRSQPVESDSALLERAERAERDLGEAWNAIKDALEELERHPNDPAGDIVARQMAANVLYNYQHDFKSSNSRSHNQD